MWLGALQIILDKGQEVDWFGATWLRWATFLLVVALVGFLVRELTHDKPLVDLRIFRNRNFLTGCILIFLFGGVVYGLITILPLFFQELLGYTALGGRDWRLLRAAWGRSSLCRRLGYLPVRSITAT